MDSELHDNADGGSSRNTEESPSHTETDNIETNKPIPDIIEEANTDKSIQLEQPEHNESLQLTSELSSNIDPAEFQINIIEEFEIDDDSLNAGATALASESNSLHSPDDDSCEENEEMRRIAAKNLIERYFFQLMDGCGTKNCPNKYCASSGKLEKFTANEAAARALQLFAQDAKLCKGMSYKIPRTNEILPSAEDPTAMIIIGCSGNNRQNTNTSSSNDSRNSLLDTQSHHNRMDMPTCSNSRGDRNSKGNNCQTSPHDEYSNISEPTSPSSLSSFEYSGIENIGMYRKDEQEKYLINCCLDEQKVEDLIELCTYTESNELLIQRVSEVFSSPKLLSMSFRIKTTSESNDDFELPTELRSLTKEDLRMLEKDLDKDEDSTDINNDNDDVKSDNTENPNPETEIDVDIPCLKRSMGKVFATLGPNFETLNTALHSLSLLLDVDVRLDLDKSAVDTAINLFVAVFEVMSLDVAEFIDVALPSICKAAAHLPIWGQAKLARIWAANCQSSLKTLLNMFQEVIILQAIACNVYHAHVEENETITTVTQVLKILYYGNMLAGKLETSSCFQNDDSSASGTVGSGDGVLDTIPEDDDFYIYSHVVRPNSKKTIEDDLELELSMSILDCRIPYIPFEDFYNEPLSDTIEMDNDYLYYKSLTIDSRGDEERKFTFMLYSFILTPATKVVALYYDSRIRMYSERRLSIFQHANLYVGDNNGAGPNPYLKLKVRRDHLIGDALVELEMIAMGSPKDFKKQLVVEFIGEQGIDEGGVSKEFFQLVVQEIFNPDFGMFIYHEDTQTFWFNSTSLENEAQFTLIGIVVGLAIYNSIILAVNFPMVVYRKLMGGRGTFFDLATWNPLLHKGLKSILDYKENDIEDMFMQTFQISYKDVFGNIIRHDLKPNGSDIFINHKNKKEFVELYSDYLLNTSIERQFKAFKRGFEMVTDESPLKLLFRPEEIELLVCGSKNFDFRELEEATEYDGGFTKHSTIIVDFWKIVHSLSLESKKKLLEFTTGSDRAPVGGLGRLKLVISRNGPDSDRLPTSHTCFNILLLPEYISKEKLQDRLIKAITYSKGFGML